MLSRKIVEQGIYPAVDPLESTSRSLEPDVVGQRHYDVARATQEVLQRYRELQDIIAILGMEGALRRGQAHRQPGPENPAVLLPALLCGPGLHRQRGPLCARGGDYQGL